MFSLFQNGISLHHCRLQLYNFDLHVRFSCLRVALSIQDVIIFTQFVLYVFFGMFALPEVPRFINSARLLGITP